MLLLPLSFTANGLSATTAQVIEGTAPYLVLSDGKTKLTSLDELLGFSMWDGTYEEETKKHMVPITSKQTAPLSVPVGLTYQDVITLVTADGGAHNVSGVTVGDDDGDADNPVNTSIAGKMTATWYKGTVADANKVSDLTAGLPNRCDGGDYNLVISAEDVEAKTTYGVPNSYSYGSSTPITYTFKALASTGGCIKWLKPASLHIYTGTANVDIKYAIGYNSAKFDTTNGFKVDSGFPTTGFAGASFSLIGSGTDQRLYRCKSDNAGTETSKEILLSGTSSQSLGEYCTVTYKTDAAHQVRPTRDITIVMQARSTVSSSDWADIDSFTIKKDQIRLWAVGRGIRAYFPALSACSGQTVTNTSHSVYVNRQKYLYRRNELTNSPYADPDIYKEGTSPSYGGYLSRDADGTFMGEWGVVYFYSGSGWVTGNYWTAEAYSATDLFYVRMNGNIHAWFPSDPNNLVAMCRG